MWSIQSALYGVFSEMCRTSISVGNTLLEIARGRVAKILQPIVRYILLFGNVCLSWCCFCWKRSSVAILGISYKLFLNILLLRKDELFFPFCTLHSFVTNSVVLRFMAFSDDLILAETLVVQKIFFFQVVSRGGVIWLSKWPLAYGGSCCTVGTGRHKTVLLLF